MSPSQDSSTIYPVYTLTPALYEISFASCLLLDKIKQNNTGQPGTSIVYLKPKSTREGLGYGDCVETQRSFHIGSGVGSHTITSFTMDRIPLTNMDYSGLSQIYP